MRAVYVIVHHQPCAQHAAITGLIHWLYRHAQWQDTVYTDAAIPVKFQAEGYEPVWCTDVPLFAPRPAWSKCFSCMFLSYFFVCVRLGGST